MNQLVDIRKLSPGTTVYVETADDSEVWKLSVLDPVDGRVIVETTDKRLRGREPLRCELLRSYNHLAAHDCALVKDMFFALQFSDGILTCGRVATARVEGINNSWHYDAIK